MSRTGTARETGVLRTDGRGRLVVRTVMVRVTAGPDAGREARLESGSLFVGSSAESDLRLGDPTVSRHHAELALLSSGVRIRDLSSKNGTFYRGARIEALEASFGAWADDEGDGADYVEELRRGMERRLTVR